MDSRGLFKARISGDIAAGATNVAGVGLDTQANGGLRDIEFLVFLGICTGTIALRLQSSDDDSLYTDIPGTEISDSGPTNGVFEFLVHESPARYIRPLVVRSGGNAEILCMLAQGRQAIDMGVRSDRGGGVWYQGCRLVGTRVYPGRDQS